MHCCDIMIFVILNVVPIFSCFIMFLSICKSILIVCYLIVCIVCLILLISAFHCRLMIVGGC